MTDEGISYTEIPRLEDWLSIPEAADKLGVSKQMIHKMIHSLNVFDLTKDVRKIGEKPMYILREAAVESLKESRRGTSTE